MASTGQLNPSGCLQSLVSLPVPHSSGCAMTPIQLPRNCSATYRRRRACQCKYATPSPSATVRASCPFKSHPVPKLQPWIATFVVLQVLLVLTAGAAPSVVSAHDPPSQQELHGGAPQTQKPASSCQYYIDIHTEHKLAVWIATRPHPTTSVSRTRLLLNGVWSTLHGGCIVRDCPGWFQQVGGVQGICCRSLQLVVGGTADHNMSQV
jgi:hypothetical protein